MRAVSNRSIPRPSPRDAQDEHSAVTDRNPDSKNPAAPPRSWKSVFGRWFSSPEQEAPEQEPETSAPVGESAPPRPPVKRPAPESIQPLIDTLGPDSERTVYKRVPNHLLDRARDSHPVSDLPAPQSYDEDDRTAVFSPPADLLRGVWEEESRHETITARPPPDAQPALLAELKPSTPPLSSPEARMEASSGHASTPSVPAQPVADSEPPSSAPALTLEAPEIPHYTEPLRASDFPEPMEGAYDSEDANEDEEAEEDEPPSAEGSAAPGASRSMLMVLCVLAALAAVAYAYLQSAPS